MFHRGCNRNHPLRPQYSLPLRRGSVLRPGGPVHSSGQVGARRRPDLAAAPGRAQLGGLSRFGRGGGTSQSAIPAWMASAASGGEAAATAAATAAAAPSQADGGRAGETSDRSAVLQEKERQDRRRAVGAVRSMEEYGGPTPAHCVRRDPELGRKLPGTPTANWDGTPADTCAGHGRPVVNIRVTSRDDSVTDVREALLSLSLRLAAVPIHSLSAQIPAELGSTQPYVTGNSTRSPNRLSLSHMTAVIYRHTTSHCSSRCA